MHCHRESPLGKSHHSSANLSVVSHLQAELPLFGRIPANPHPEVYCIAVDDGRRSCMTEQGTRYEMDKKICRSIAANGVYNPYRRPTRKLPR